MDKEKIGLTLLILFLGVAGIYFSLNNQAAQTEPLEQNFTQIDFEDHSFMVEIADSPEERRRGLMFREELGENEGMLFVYDQEAPRSFWMKNTLIPLDIIFLDSDFQVINIEKADPEPNTSDENLASYSSERPAQYVLEINQDRSEELGLEKGSEMSLRP